MLSPPILFLLLILAVFGVVLTYAAVSLKIDALTARMERLEKRTPESRPLPVVEKLSSLASLRIAVVVIQDHPHPIFAELLKQNLLKADASDVDIFANLDATQPTEHDVRVEGKLTCNGYAEVYYDAEFTCSTQTEPICTLIERPPGGDRPAHLAIELVAKLEAKLGDLIARAERRRAIRELGAP